MRLRPVRRPPAGHTVTVQAWGAEPIGAGQVETILARFGGDMAGFTYPTPAGWGMAGSVEETDSSIWASPQAFTGDAGRVALSALILGAERPTRYPVTAEAAGVVLPGPSGV